MKAALENYLRESIDENISVKPMEWEDKNPNIFTGINRNRNLAI